jgi:hypothetical protein
LTQLEADLGRPIYKSFDEIWSSSIGSMIGALLTKSAPEGTATLSASEITEFLENSFSSFPRALRIRSAFRELVPDRVRLGETLIPLRILVAEVLQSRMRWPLLTTNRSLSSQDNSQVSLASVVSASCTVFPVHPVFESLQTEEGRVLQFIDAGCDVCTESQMNPLVPHLTEFLKNPVNLERSIAIYFVSTGWVRLESDINQVLKTIEVGSQHSAGIEIYNLDVDFRAIIEAWQKEYLWARVFRLLNNEHLLYNLAGGGLIPSSFLLTEAKSAFDGSDNYKKILKTLF